MDQLILNAPNSYLESDESLSGQVLIAMPAMQDNRFARSIIYVCAHSDEGAMGLIINRPAKSMEFSDLISQLFTAGDTTAIKIDEQLIDHPSIHIGGPVETGRGFVLHSADYYADENTFPVNEHISLTATLDILRAMAKGSGPDHALLALGYAGWAPGQLETEISDNGWLTCAPNIDFVFDTDPEQKYDRAFTELGINPAHLVADIGHA